MADDEIEISWADYFTRVKSVPQVFRVGRGPDDVTVQQLTNSPVPHHAWPISPMGSATRAWSFLDGGLLFVEDNYGGGGLDPGVRVIGFHAMRYVSAGVRLDPPTEPLPGEGAVPSYDELHSAVVAGNSDPAMKRRALLLSAVGSAAMLRDFVRLVETGSIPDDLGLEGAGVTDRLKLSMYLMGEREWIESPEESALDAVISAPVEVTSTPMPAAPPGKPAPDPNAPLTHAQIFIKQYEEAQEDDDYSRIDFYEGDDDWFDPDGLTADVLADLYISWDYGMPAGSGTASLVAFPDGSAVWLSGDDFAGEPQLAEFPADEEGRARAVADWCNFYSGDVPLAALSLEPLDPNDTLTDEARAEWESAISSSPSHVHVPTTGRLGELVREVFSADPVYARIKAALANPTSEEGRLCLQAIDYLQVGTNELCGGQWEDLDT